jgi:shikimate kinase/3-dehydroquinate synthase
VERHLALIGFMGAGKSTLGAQVAETLGREFVDLDAFIEEFTGRSIAEIFATDGESSFRSVEYAAAEAVLDRREPRVVALGGGAVTTAEVSELLGRLAVTVLVDVDVERAWERAQGSDRPLAHDEADFRRLYDERQPLYEGVADAVARDVHDAVLAAGGVSIAPLESLGELVDGPAALVSDAHVAGIHGPTAQMALGARVASRHELPPGEEAKTLDAVHRLWHELRLDRRGTVVALGGGTTTDAAGFAAATYLRGVPWVSVPTTLVGQVDAGIGGKTGINLAQGKNLIGAFHWPRRTLIDPAVLATLPERERREGMSEVVKTGLLAGEPLWELPVQELVRRCAAFKTAVCLRDPLERGERAQLNLGHTFAHALETGSGGSVTHGTAVALGLLAALRLSGRDTKVVEELLRPRPVAADRERAWQALLRDKKGALRLILLGEGGPRVEDVPAEDVRRELDRLIT